MKYIFSVVIELACGEYGRDKIDIMVASMDNGECTNWFRDSTKILKLEDLRQMYPLSKNYKENGTLEATSSLNQLKILLKRGYMKGKRDATLTHLR